MFTENQINNPKNDNQTHQPIAPFKPNTPNSAVAPKMRELGNYMFSFDWKLGSGLTSDAYIGLQKATKKMVCVKVVDLATFKSNAHKQLLQNQIRCQQKLQSEHIINVYDIYDTSSFCFIVTELCEDGDLFKLIKYSQNGLPEQLVTKLGYQIAQALKTMKEHSIIHRDIKSENIMLSNGQAKLGDFGFAIEQKNLQSEKSMNIGSPLYMALQSLQSNEYSYASDIFSYGVVLYEMLHGQSPWECSVQQELIEKIKTQEVDFKDKVSEPMRKLIRRCLQKQRQDRITVEEVLESEVFHQRDQ